MIILGKKFSTKKPENCTLLEYNNHEYFNNDSFHIDSMLSNYIENILDLSLNEVNVHYLGHSEVLTEYPYLEIES